MKGFIFDVTWNNKPGTFHHLNPEHNENKKKNGLSKELIYICVLNFSHMEQQLRERQ